VRRFALLLLATLASCHPVHATEESTCGEANLLAEKSPLAWRDVFRPDMVTDGVMARDGDPDLGTRSAVLAGPHAVLEYDLGARRHVTSAFLQASSLGRLVLDLSEDRQAWTPMMTLEPTSGAGLKTRMTKRFDGRGRYVRLRAAGNGTIGLSELQIFCQTPAALAVSVLAAQPVPAAPEVAVTQTRHALQLLVPVTLALFFLFRMPGSRRRAPLAIALAAAALVLSLAFSAAELALWTGAVCGAAMTLLAALVLFARRARSPDPTSLRLSSATAALLIGVAAMAYTNYGRFASAWSVHYHDALHYVLGAKYAPELHYDGLYACLVDANAEEQRWSGVVPALVRDLRDDKLLSANEISARGQCKTRFSPERWSSFRRDAAFFMGQLSPRAWVAVFTDHGYNATPVWTWLGRQLFSNVSLSTRALARMAHIDELAYALMVFLLAWYWKPERVALAAVLFAFGFPWIYLWVGGGVGRSLWLLALVAALALSARRRFVAGGIALGVSSALQLFPVLLLAGPLLLAARRDGSEAAAQARSFVVAATLTGMVLVLLSLQVAGPSLWLDFIRNTARQAASDSVNRIGPAVIAAQLGAGKVVGRIVPIVILGLWLRSALRARDPVRLLSLSALVPMFALRLSSYYLILVTALVPILDSWQRVLLACLAFLFLPQAIGLLARGEPGPGAYAWMSASIVALGIALCVLEGRGSLQNARY
jgi:hypothetical protein